MLSYTVSQARGNKQKQTSVVKSSATASYHPSFFFQLTSRCDKNNSQPKTPNQNRQLCHFSESLPHENKRASGKTIDRGIKRKKKRRKGNAVAWYMRILQKSCFPRFRCDGGLGRADSGYEAAEELRGARMEKKGAKKRDKEESRGGIMGDPPRGKVTCVNTGKRSSLQSIFFCLYEVLLVVNMMNDEVKWTKREILFTGQETRIDILFR